MKIITKTDLQKNIAKLSHEPLIVVNRGKPEIVVLPYFAGNEQMLEDYLEQYEMNQNKQALNKQLKKSAQSGKSGFKV